MVNDVQKVMHRNILRTLSRKGYHALEGTKSISKTLHVFPASMNNSFDRALYYAVYHRFKTDKHVTEICTAVMSYYCNDYGKNTCDKCSDNTCTSCKDHALKIMQNSLYMNGVKTNSKNGKELMAILVLFDTADKVLSQFKESL